MKIEFKVTSEEHEDLTPFTNALERGAFISELFTNFHRKYKYIEDEVKQDIVYDLLNEIRELALQYKVIIE